MRSRVDPFFQFRYMRHATPRLRQFVHKLSREARPVRPSFALLAILATAVSAFIL